VSGIAVTSIVNTESITAFDPAAAHSNNGATGGCGPKGPKIGCSPESENKLFNGVAPGITGGTCENIEEHRAHRAKNKYTRKTKLLFMVFS
jgi:hypothetical protein